MKRLALLAASALFGGTVHAAPLELSGKVEGRIGYGTNPFVRPGTDKASAFGGINVAPVLTHATETGTIKLLGVYDRDEYARIYGSPNTASIGLAQSSKLNPRLSLTSGISYIDTTSPLSNGDVDASTDPLSIGTRTRKIQGNVGLDWRPTSVDTISTAANAIHGSYKRNTGIGSYDFYAGNISYLRRLGDRTQIGVRLGVARTEFAIFPSVTSYEPSFVLVQQFSSIWTFNGNIGVTLRHTPSLGRTSKGIGFSAGLCGTYPETTICVTANRTTSASGIGGARISTSGSVKITHKLSATDDVTLNASYISTKPVTSTPSLFVRPQQFTQLFASYDHRLNSRLSVGGEGRLQARSQSGLPNGDSIGGSLHVRYLFGRLEP